MTPAPSQVRLSHELNRALQSKHIATLQHDHQLAARSDDEATRLIALLDHYYPLEEEVDAGTLPIAVAA